MKQFVIQRWFLILLAVVLGIGLRFPQESAPIADWISEAWVVAGVLFLMALPLEIRAMWRALNRPVATVLAIAINSGLLPLVAWGMSGALAPELGAGLIITAAVPCTLASAAVWTRRAGGNDAIALLVMVVTNLTCFIVTPFWLYVSTGASVEIDFQDMVLKLALLVVLPMVVAQFLRISRPIATWATRQRIGLSVLAQCGILVMVFSGAVQAGLRLAAQPSNQALRPLDWTAMLVSVVVLHVAMLLVGLGASRMARLDAADSIAVGIAGSQKTLMVGVHIGVSYGGLAMLPMVAYHVSQLLIDTVVADWWRGRNRMTVEPNTEPVAELPAG
jgi:sodium/bile acid cotransporter 7